MFGLSFTHLILLAVIVLIFIGPEQLPEVARTIARLLNEWKRASSDLQSSLTNSFTEDLQKPPPQAMAEPPPQPTVEEPLSQASAEEPPSQASAEEPPSQASAEEPPSAPSEIPEKKS